eukprot:scaffold92808_cov17-Tisochrysis_lutea.AAC.2
MEGACCARGGMRAAVPAGALVRPSSGGETGFGRVAVQVVQGGRHRGRTGGRRAAGRWLRMGNPRIQRFASGWVAGVLVESWLHGP